MESDESEVEEIDNGFEIEDVGTADVDEKEDKETVSVSNFMHFLIRSFF